MLVPDDKRKTSLADVIPQSWRKEGEQTTVVSVAYKVSGANKELIFQRPVVIDMVGVRAILIYAALSYCDAGSAKFDTTDPTTLVLTVSPQINRETPKDVHLIFLAPLAEKELSNREASGRRAIRGAAAIFAACNGRNMVYERVFENVLRISTGQTVFFTPVLRNPLSYPQPDISENSLRRIKYIDDGIQSFPVTEQNRIRLSLHWLEMAMRDDGIDALLKYWTAIETLGMPDDTNVRPVVEILAKGYGLEYKNAITRFGIGRIQGLRSRIVHAGQMPPISSHLLDYLEAVYVDLLFFTLGLKCENRTAAILDNPDFKLDKYLHES
jgi:hypothetical protein